MSLTAFQFVFLSATERNLRASSGQRGLWSATKMSAMVISPPAPSPDFCDDNDRKKTHWHGRPSGAHKFGQNFDAHLRHLRKEVAHLGAGRNMLSSVPNS